MTVISIDVADEDLARWRRWADDHEISLDEWVSIGLRHWVGRCAAGGPRGVEGHVALAADPREFGPNGEIVGIV